jgi:hypothetical protein
VKCQGSLWDGMISFERLLRAAHAAARGKRFKPGVARFLFDLERQLLMLHDELASKTYRAGPYRTFAIYEGKTSPISAAPFRDGVVVPDAPTSGPGKRPTIPSPAALDAASDCRRNDRVRRHAAPGHELDRPCPSYLHLSLASRHLS